MSLAVEKIDCFLADEEIVRLNWFWSNAVGGARLQILEENAAAAMEILGQEIPATFGAEDLGEEYQQPRCPNCNSLDVSFQEYSGLSLFILYLFNLPIPIRKNRWKCEDCRHQWREEPS